MMTSTHHDPVPTEGLEPVFAQEGDERANGDNSDQEGHYVTDREEAVSARWLRRPPSFM